MQCICLKYYHCVMIFFVFIDKMVIAVVGIFNFFLNFFLEY